MQPEKGGAINIIKMLKLNTQSEEEKSFFKLERKNSIINEDY
jgi:hypothetical protein